MNEIKGYVTRSVLSTLGLSLYILADTFFIANGVGVLGLAALNIAMPLFNLLTGLGLCWGWRSDTVNCRWDHWTDFYATGSLF